MGSDKKLPLIEIIFIIFISTLTPVYFKDPALITPPANQDVWFVSLVSIPYTIVICLPLLFLSNKFTNLTLIEIIQMLCGRIIGGVLGILYIAFMMLICVLGSVDTIQFLGSAIIPETPVYVIMIFLLLTCSYLAYKGIDAIGRSTVIYAPIILCVIFLFTILNIHKMSFKTFLPALADTKLWQINAGAFTFAARFYDIILLCMLVPNIENKKNINKSFYYSLGIYIFISIIMTVSTQAILGIEQAKHARYPYLVFARQVDVFDFIQRIESLTIMSWFFARFIKISAYIYIILIAVKKIFNTKDHNKFIIPNILVTYVIVTKTSISKSVVFSKILSYKVFPYITSTFVIIIPLFLLVVYFFRRKKLQSFKYR